MGLINKILTGLSISYVTSLTILTLVSFKLSNIYLIAGFISLFLILFSDKVQWVGVLLVYIPALWCLYLLVAVGEPGPFISLAAGYILALPLVIMISGLMSYMTGGIISYILATLSAVSLHNASLNGYNTPEKLFIYLVNTISGTLTQQQAIQQLHTTSQIPALNILAAVSIIAFVIFLMNSSGDRRIYKARIRIEPDGIVLFLLSIIVALISAQVSNLFLGSSTIVLLVVLAGVMLAVSLSSRV